MPSLNLNPEVDFLLYGRHLENGYDVITPPPLVQLLRNLAGWRKLHADDYTCVKIKTGNRITIWRPPFFRNWK